MTTFNETTITTFEVIQCGSCAIRFGVPEAWIDNKRKNAGDFHCPNGCHRTYSKSEAQRLKEQLEAKEVELSRSKCETLKEQNKRIAIEAEKEKAEKKLRRVKNGVCPCCTRSFANLQRHIATKHPELKSA